MCGQSGFDNFMDIAAVLFAIYGCLCAYGWARGYIGWLERS